MAWFKMMSEMRIIYKRDKQGCSLGTIWEVDNEGGKIKVYAWSKNARGKITMLTFADNIVFFRLKNKDWGRY